MKAILAAMFMLVFASSAVASVWIANGGDGGVQIGGFPIIVAELQDDNQHIVGKVDLVADSVNYRVMINAQNKLCYQYTSGSVYDTICGTTTMINDTQYRFGITTQTLGNDTNLLIYLDGVLEANSTMIGVPDTNNNILTMGKTSDNTGQFEGVLDNIRIYNKQLNSTQINNELYANYSNETPRFTYDFELGSNITAYDTHFEKWNTEWGILMFNGDYDNSTQCVTYDSPGPTYFESGLIRLILDNLLVFVALGILTTIVIWIVMNQ